MNYVVDTRKIVKALLFKKQQGNCAECKRPLDVKYGLRYFTSLEYGGTETYDNVELIHVQCGNAGTKQKRTVKAWVLQKGGKKPQEIAQELGMSLSTVIRYLKTE